ncbi:MAG: hypothetical protein MHM6MM_007293 [Cercozoa sp. M6MM]
MVFSAGSCACPPGWTEKLETCVKDSDLATAQTELAQYSNTDTELEAHYALCLEDESTRNSYSCSAVLNYCAQGNETACSVYGSTQVTDAVLLKDTVFSVGLEDSVELRVAKFAQNGTLLSFELLGQTQLFCAGDSILSEAANVGQGVELKCNDVFEELFLEFHLLDESTESHVLVPARVGSDDTYWRRVSAWKDSNTKKLKRFVLNFVVETSNVDASDEEKRQLLRPFIELEFTDDTKDVTEVLVVWKNSSLGAYWSVWSATLAALSIVAFTIAGFKMWAWQRRRLRQNFVVDFDSASQRWWSAITAIFLGLWSLMTVILTKAQTAPSFLLDPSDSAHSAFYGVCTTAMVCSVLALFHSLWRQSFCDVILMDWEPHDENKQNSAWRGIFVANEWSELQARRSISPLVVFASVVVVRVALNFDSSYASLTPKTSDNANAPTSAILQFGLSACIVAVACALLFALRRLVLSRTRTAQDEVSRFVDVLTLANTSLLCLDEAFHGFYLHGKSCHACADASLQELRAQLERERRGLVRPRGLLDSTEKNTLSASGGVRDVFEVFTSAALRHKLDHLGAALHPAARPLSADTAWDSQQAVSRGDQRLFEASHARERFLKLFVRRQLRQFPWQVVAPENTSWLETKMGARPFHPDSRTSLFVDDANYSFASLLLSGLEWQMHVTSLLLLPLLEALVQDVFSACALVLLCNYLVQHVRAFLGKRNLARKALVDEMFLD